MNSSKTQLNILIVEDEEPIANGLMGFLRLNPRYNPHWIGNGKDGLEYILKHSPDIVILDIKLPKLTGLEVLKQLKNRMDKMPVVIMVSGQGDMEAVIAAFRLGAYDYFQKPVSPKDLDQTIHRTEQYCKLVQALGEREKEVMFLKEQVGIASRHKLIGASKETRRVKALISTISKSSDACILITGESGTGKEVVARQVHQESERASHHFVAVNCTALSESLFESEMFGHVKGSFTGAVSDRTGFLEFANGGTLLLDEIAELKPELQVKLLRVLDARTYFKVGSTQERKFDVRVIAATNRNIDEMVANGSFRQDLLYRLNTFQIHLEPLRNRVDDIAPLSNYFLEEFSASKNQVKPLLTEGAKQALLTYNYPGNVRELRNAIERAWILSGGGEIIAEHFQFYKSPAKPENLFDNANLNLDEIEKYTFMQALKKCNYKRKETAVLLGLTPQSLDRRIIKHGLERKG